MRLKRIYANEGDKMTLAGIKVLEAGPVQKFSPRAIDKMVAEGMMAVDGDMLALATEPPLTYRIVRKPGTYCCYCNAPVDSGAPALAHVAEHKAAAAMPQTLGSKILGFFGAKKAAPEIIDPNNPAGYRVDNFFYCERV